MLYYFAAISTYLCIEYAHVHCTMHSVWISAVVVSFSSRFIWLCLRCLWRLRLDMYACACNMEVRPCTMCMHLQLCGCQPIAIYSHIEFCQLLQTKMNAHNTIAYEVISKIFVWIHYFFTCFSFCFSDLFHFLVLCTPRFIQLRSFLALNLHVSIALDIRIILVKQTAAIITNCSSNSGGGGDGGGGSNQHNV